MPKRLQVIRVFLRELPRRGVAQAAVAYAVGAWVIIEIASVIMPAFEAPNWALQLVIALCVLGFPVVLVFSWIFDLSLAGLVRTDDIDARGVSPPEVATPEAAEAGNLEPAPEEAVQHHDASFAERRQITVLRYTLRCNDENGLQLDPETLRDILPDAQRDCAEIVGRYNGYMAWAHQEEGQAYFGYPKALEHGARSAVRCAMELRDRIGGTGKTSDFIDLPSSIKTCV